jgi:hypothetical protein
MKVTSAVFWDMTPCRLGDRYRCFEGKSRLHFQGTKVIRRVDILYVTYRGAGKSLARPTSRSILFDGENISFDASLVIYIYK